MEGSRNGGLRRSAGVVAGVLAWACLIPAGSGEALGSSWDTDCHAIKLKSASGLPGGGFRSYHFVGTCNLNQVLDSGPSVKRIFPAEAHVEWEAGKRELRETFSIIGSFPHPSAFQAPLMIGGDVRSVYKCNDDPIVAKGVACTGAGHQNNTNLPCLSNSYNKKSRPITAGKTSLAEAIALSSGNVAGGGGGLTGHVSPPRADPGPRGEEMTQAASKPRPFRFQKPALNGHRVDACYKWGSECGAPAADAFCRKVGYARASGFEVERGVGATMVLADGKLCAQPACDGFSTITCVH